MRRDPDIPGRGRWQVLRVSKTFAGRLGAWLHLNPSMKLPRSVVAVVFCACFAANSVSQTPAQTAPTVPSSAAAPGTSTPPTPAAPTPIVTQTPAASNAHPVASNVTLGDKPILAIFTSLGQFSPADRASVTSARIAQIAHDPSFNLDGITTAERGNSTDVVAGDMLLLTVSDQDAFFDTRGRTRQALAAEDAQVIRHAIEQDESEYSVATLTLGALKAAVSAVILLALLLSLRFVFPRIYQAIHSRRGTRIKTIRIQSLELLSEQRITEVLVQVAHLVRFALTLLLFYFWIPLVFSFFAPTRRFGHTLIEYVLAPLHRGWSGFLAYLPSLLVVLLVVFFAIQALRLSRLLFREVERGTLVWPGFYSEWAMPTSRIVDVLIVALAIVIAFPYLPGSDSAAFKGVSIFLGVLLSLGSSTAIANIVAGVLLTYTRAFRVGDRVQIADTTGDVIEQTLLATHLRTTKNVNVTVPNGLVLASHIINFSRTTPDRPLILNTRMTVSYNTDWRLVHRLLIASAEATPGVLHEPKPFVLQTALDDFYVSYQINAYTHSPGQMDGIYSDLNLQLLDHFRAAGIDIVAPHYSVLMNQGGRTPAEKPASGQVAEPDLEAEAHAGHPHADPHSLGLE